MEGGGREGRGIKVVSIISPPLFGADLRMAVSCPQGITVTFVAGAVVARSRLSSLPRTGMPLLMNRFGLV